MKVIPVINELNFSDLSERINKFESYFNWVQIDIIDGLFADRKTGFGFNEINSLETNLNLEVHLMIKEPESSLENWFKIDSVKRVIIHVEEISDFKTIKELARKYNKDIGLAVKIETDLKELEKYFNEVDFFLFLGVQPGFSGQKFNNSILEKIKGLKEIYPESIISIDGGINPETSPLVKEAGADIVYSSSFLFNSPNIEEAVKKLS